MKSKMKNEDRESFEDFSRKIGYVNSVEDWAKRHKLNTYVATVEHKEIKEGIITEVGKKQGSTVFDLGCGYGFLISKINKVHPETNVVGGDISKFQVHNARDRRVKGGLVVCCAEFIPFRDGTFDSVACSEVIEHVIEPKSSLIEITRVLKNNGTLCISTDNPLSLWRRTLSVFSKMNLLNKGVKEEFLPLTTLTQLLPKNIKVFKVSFTCPYPLLPNFGPLKNANVGRIWILLWKSASKLPYAGKHFYNKYAIFTTKHDLSQ